MDLSELGDVGSRCDDENCSLALGYPESCSNQKCHFEEPVFGLIELVCVTVIYIPLMLFGLLGNTLTILVVWLRPHMRSSTYLYLSSMSVSDMLILLLLPLDLYKLWRPKPWLLGDLLCKLTMFLSECCTFCTILHITVLSLERYLAVCWPITAKTLVTRRRTRTIIGCLWLGAAVSAAPVLVMVGVEDVGVEDLGHSGWHEGPGWSGREGEQGFIIGGREGGNGHEAFKEGGLEEKSWEEKVKVDRGVKDEELKNTGGKMEGKLEIKERGERKHGNDVGAEEEGPMEVEGERQNKMKEDEGGGRDDSVSGGHREEIDNRECRCTHYAVSSGLLSAMMILYNLYFLVPFCILGLVYSLIGRTLWLRPQNSRRDQNHRHTVKMLGVIVLAFVLCWLPFHVGRTIFSLSVGSERQETYLDSSSQPNIQSDGSVDRHFNTQAPEPLISHPDSDIRLENPSATGRTSVHSPRESDETDKQMAKTETQMHTDKAVQPSSETHFSSYDVSETRERHRNNDISTRDLYPSPEINTDATTYVYTHGSHSDTSTRTDGNTSERVNRSCCTDVSALTTIQNLPSILTHSQSDLNRTSHRGDNVTPHHLYNTQDGLPFNNTSTYSDTRLYFLYYLSQYFNLVSSVLFYLSAAVNPLLYNLMSARYRHAVHSLIRKQSHTQSQHLHTITSRHSSTTI